MAASFTKFILHGGNTRDRNADNDAFFRAMTLDAQGQTLVLLNYFSREENEIEACFLEDQKRFLENSENPDLVFEVADPARFGEQLQRAQVVYMRGGNTQKLMEGLSQTPHVATLFKGKTVAGSSAGAYALSQYYRGNKSGRLGAGLGLLPFKTFCHYSSEEEENLKLLLDYKERLPVLTLKDHQWVVFFG